jgi:hypothetical protein
LSKENFKLRKPKTGTENSSGQDMNPGEYVRIQFNMSPEAVKMLEKLRQETSSPSRAYVIKKALGLLRWMLDLRKEGKEIYLKNQDGEMRRIVFTDFEIF